MGFKTLMMSINYIKRKLFSVPPDIINEDSSVDMAVQEGEVYYYVIHITIIM